MITGKDILCLIIFIGIALWCGVLVVRAFKAGRTRLEGYPVVSRAENPGRFWFCFILQGAVGLLFLGFLIFLLVGCTGESSTPSGQVVSTLREVGGTILRSDAEAVAGAIMPQSDVRAPIEIPESHWTESIRKLKPVRVFWGEESLRIITSANERYENGIIVYFPSYADDGKLLGGFVSGGSGSEQYKIEPGIYWFWEKQRVPARREMPGELRSQRVYVYGDRSDAIYEWVFIIRDNILVAQRHAFPGYSDRTFFQVQLSNDVVAQSKNLSALKGDIAPPFLPGGGWFYHFEFTGDAPDKSQQYFSNKNHAFAVFAEKLRKEALKTVALPTYPNWIQQNEELMKLLGE